MKPKVKKVRFTPRERTKLKIRKRLVGSNDKPRICVYKSSKYTYAQVISDDTGKTMLTVSTREPAVKDRLASVDREGLHKSESTSAKSCVSAKALGMILAEQMKQKGIAQAVFDRNGFKYHGRIRAVAEGVRAGGMTI